MPIIEREDDGTERCSVCGKLHWGWDYICPQCGTNYRPKPLNAPHGDLTGFVPTLANIRPDYRDAAVGLARAFNDVMNGIHLKPAPKQPRDKQER